MRISVADAVRSLDERGLVKRRRHNDADRIVSYVRDTIGRDLPASLSEFYAESVELIDKFRTIVPIWSDFAGWRPIDFAIDGLLEATAIPIVSDGCGSYFGLDISTADADPAVYFFDHEDGFLKPSYAAGSSLGAFLLLYADRDRAFREQWPDRWELKIDPDIENCPRAPAIWNAG